MAFCGECGTKAVGEFCINCGRPILIPDSGIDPSREAARAAEEAALKLEEAARAAQAESERQALIDQKIAEARQAEIQRQEQLAADAAAARAQLEAEKAEAQARLQAEEASGKPVLEQADSESIVQPGIEPRVEDYPQETAPYKADKRPASLKPVAIAAAGVVLLGALLFPSSGKLKVVFSDETSSNPPVALNLNVNGELVRIDTGRLRDGVLFERDWSAFQPIEIEVIPDPLADEVVATSTMQIGTLGIWNLGRDLVVNVVSYDSWTEIDVTGPNNFFESRTSEGLRSNFAMASLKCAEDFTEQHALKVNLVRQANANYVKYVKESQLEGDRTLTYTTWAARSERLIGKLTSYIKLIESNPLPSPTSEHNTEREAVLTDLNNLKTRWRGLANIARDEDEARWDGAWTLIYEEEAALLDSTKAFRALSENAKDVFCQSKLVRK